ncbi:MAG: endonuclease [Oscillospiraceae bacterium]|nr:endonuclease [Oscillospiraceae bacterium]
MKKFLKFVGVLLLVIVLAIAIFLGFLTVTALNPKTAKATVSDPGENSTGSLANGDSFTIMTWNVGYASLGKESDFFMDGGKQSRPESQQIVDKNIAGIVEQLRPDDHDFMADIMLLQEVDSGSKRSFGVVETDAIAGEVGFTSAYALNYKCAYVPIPLSSPLGKVSSGVFTMTSTEISDAERIALPSPFKWPVSVANLKRCLLVTRVPLEDTDKELVIVNLHLEAYDDGEGKAAQTKALMDFLTAEYEKGNYVIAGGDFNQTFPGALDKYPVKNADLWTPGTLSESDLPGEGWQFVTDISTPTCRLLNEPYDPASDATQYYVIDGFIVSPNVRVDEVETVNAGFEFSDHNPVRMDITLQA